MKVKMASQLIIVIVFAASATLGFQLVGSAQALGTYGAQAWIESPTSIEPANTTISLLVTAQIIYRSNSSVDDQINTLLQSTSCQFSVDGGAWQNLTFVQLAGTQSFIDPIYNNWFHEDNCTYRGTFTAASLTYHSLNVTIESPDSQGSSQMYFTVGTATPTAAYQVKGTWTQLTPMIQPRFDAGAVVVEGAVYVVGGSRTQANGNGFTTVPTGEMESWVPGGLWMKWAPLPVPMQSFGAATYKGLIYAIGGSANFVYDPKTNTWAVKAPMPTPRTNLQANVVGGKIYLIGGEGQNVASNANEAYDPATDTWTSYASIPVGVCNYASTVADGKIYIISGYTGNLGTASAANLTQVYDPATNMWRQAASIPISAASSAAAVLTGNDGSTDLYVVNGAWASNPFEAQAITQVYFPTNNTWSQATPMMVDRAGLAATVVGNTLYTFGGGHNIFTPDSADVWQFTPEAATSSSAKSQPIPTTSATPAKSPIPTNSVPEFTTNTGLLLVLTVTGLAIILTKKAQTRTTPKRVWVQNVGSNLSGLCFLNTCNNLARKIIVANTYKARVNL
jgi:hypothetical protein